MVLPPFGIPAKRKQNLDKKRKMRYIITDILLFSEIFFVAFLGASNLFIQGGTKCLTTMKRKHQEKITERKP